MKTNIKPLMLLVAWAMAFTACTEAFEETAIVSPDENLVGLTISTGRPDAADTRTMVAEDGKTPLWCPEDAIGVSVLSGSSYTNHEFTNYNTESPTRITTFSGKTAVGDLLYSYYPYTSGGVNDEGKVLMTIPAVQHPTATSFDGAADILVGKPVVMTPATTTIEDLQFKRVGGFLKIVINDQSGLLADETFYKISVTAENNLAGDVYLDIVNGELGKIYENGSATVTANCASDCEGTAWLGIYPQTLTEGSTIMIAATTDSYDIERKISLPYDIEIKEGQITTLSVKIGDENISEKTIDINKAFPDPIFRQYVSDNFDTDHNGILSKYEALNVRIIIVSRPVYFDDNGKIASLEGIQYFPNLTELHCSNNKLTTLDVSKNTKLTLLRCTSNPLTTLDVSKNTELTNLYCEGNQLTNLDVSKNTALIYLHCDGNQLTTLDVSQNTALTGLYCEGNQLTILDVSKNTALARLFCGNNQLTTLDVSGCAALYYLSCGNNQLTTLDVSKNTALTDLRCGSNQLTTLDVSKNTELTYLVCYNNLLTTLDVSKTNLINSPNIYNYALECAPMETLETLYLKTGWEINGITTNRSTSYIPEQTKIIFISGDYGEGGGSGGEIGDGGDHEI